ncbi:MAG: toll/interleukin-1 receptor domain-containing protein [Cyclobacteriaceae bacterium]|nr:toll/interleukin-1 receptor domain-containing protein [Cyclobacteriaceae bacterium]
MPRHILAFVDWDEFRKAGKATRPERSFYYGLAVPHLHERAGNGGTLWVITRCPGSTRYSLAYKLVNCRAQKDIPTYIQKAYGSGKKKHNGSTPLKERKLQLVVSHDWEVCEHYPENDVTDVLLRLEFVTGKAMRDCSNIGMKILGLPEVTPLCTPLLEAFALNLLKKRIVFLSYPRQDKNLADRLVLELGKRDVFVHRDVEYLLPSEPWAEALEGVIRGCDLFLVLLTDKAATSEWVKKEVEWALEEIEKGGCVSRILPLRVDNIGWHAFPELHQFHAFELKKTPTQESFGVLARSLMGLSRRRSAGWSSDGSPEKGKSPIR